MGHKKQHSHKGSKNKKHQQEIKGKQSQQDSSKQEERKSKRERKREKQSFNKAKHESDMQKFRVQLASYGLKVIEMGGDGNCLFRAIADQLEGNEKLHRKYRDDAIIHIETNKDDFAPFIEDDETIDQYISYMSKDGNWGGQVELTALSNVHKFNYVVHQVDNPIMAFSNFAWGSVPTIHLSYHLGEHYNSVRLALDPCEGPATAFPIGHELKQVDPQDQPKTKREDEKQEEAAEKIDFGLREQTEEHLVEDRDSLIQYAMQAMDAQNYDIMSKAIDECFGKGEPLSFESIEQAKAPLQSIYEEMELRDLQRQFEAQCSTQQESDPDKELSTALDQAELSANSTTEDSQNQSNGAAAALASDPMLRKKMTEQEMVRELSKEDFILNCQGEVIAAPKRNKRCPCNSKKNYKNCCYSSDLSKKTEFINRVTKKLESDVPKSQQSILLL